MKSRVAALFSLVAFAVAWLVGVWCGHSPLTRVENAGIALVAGALAGIGVAVALERIVLARLSEEWNDLREGAAAPTAPRPASTRAAPRPAAPPPATPPPAAATPARAREEAMSTTPARQREEAIR
jgi:hypothetical protein